MSAELACTYAALILNDDGIDITGDKIATILKVPSFFKSIQAVCSDCALIIKDVDKKTSCYLKLLARIRCTNFESI